MLFLKVRKDSERKWLSLSLGDEPVLGGVSPWGLELRRQGQSVEPQRSQSGESEFSKSKKLPPS